MGWPPSVGPARRVMDADLWSVSGLVVRDLPISLFTKPNSSTLLTFGKDRNFQMLAESADLLLHTEPVQAVISSWIQM